MLTWRTYRDAERAPVPVAAIEATPAYRFEPYDEVAEGEALLEPFVNARGVQSGHTQGAGERLGAEWLAEEPVLLTRERVVYDDNQNPTGTAAYHELATPESFTAEHTAYHVPYLREEALIIPDLDVPGPPEGRTFEAHPVGSGLFRVPPGFGYVQSIRVGEHPFAGRSSYDARHGMLYLETDGQALSVEAPVTCVLTEARTNRLNLEDLPEGATFVRRKGRAIGTLYKNVDRQLVDVRRYPQPDGEGQSNAVDYGYFDGSPIAHHHLYIIETNADAEAVEAAARRTLPAGALYRIESL